MTTPLTQNERSFLEREFARVEETVAELEDKLSFLYPQLAIAHDLMKNHVRGPALRLVRQQKAIAVKIAALEPKLAHANAELIEVIKKQEAR